MRIILAVAMSLGLILPVSAQGVVQVDSLKVKRGEEFPIDSPTKPETPKERREREEGERYTKSDSQEKEKNRKESEEDGIYRNQIYYELHNGQYLRRKK